jgi:hypothetical protein
VANTKRTGCGELDPVSERQHHGVAADEEKQLHAELAIFRCKPSQARDDACGRLRTMHEKHQQNGDATQQVQRLIAFGHGKPP